MKVAFGSPGWTRTNDQRINSPTLYRLSYRGTGSRDPRKGANFAVCTGPASRNPQQEFMRVRGGVARLGRVQQAAQSLRAEASLRSRRAQRRP